MDNDEKQEKPTILQFSNEETKDYIQQIVGAEMIKDLFSRIARQEIAASSSNSDYTHNNSSDEQMHHQDASRK